MAVFARNLTVLYEHLRAFTGTFRVSSNFFRKMRWHYNFLIFTDRHWSFIYVAYVKKWMSLADKCNTPNILKKYWWIKRLAQIAFWKSHSIFMKNLDGWTICEILKRHFSPNYFVHIKINWMKQSCYFKFCSMKSLLRSPALSSTFSEKKRKKKNAYRVCLNTQTATVIELFCWFREKRGCSRRPIKVINRSLLQDTQWYIIMFLPIFFYL